MLHAMTGISRTILTAGAIAALRRALAGPNLLALVDGRTTGAGLPAFELELVPRFSAALRQAVDEVNAAGGMPEARPGMEQASVIN